MRLNITPSGLSQRMIKSDSRTESDRMMSDPSSKGTNIMGVPLFLIATSFVALIALWGDLAVGAVVHELRPDSSKAEMAARATYPCGEDALSAWGCMPYLSALELTEIGALPAAGRAGIRYDLSRRTNAVGEPAPTAPRSELSAASTIHTVPQLWIGEHEAVDAAAEETAETVSGIQIPGSLLAILAALVGLIAVSRRDFLGGDGPIGRLLRENRSGRHGPPVPAHHKDAGESG